MPARLDPLKELLDLQERMNRLFDQTLANERPEDSDFAPAWAPAADVYEKEDGYVLEIELPGLVREEVVIEVRDTDLVVRGERQMAHSRSAAFHRLERRYGVFARSFRFPDPIDSQRVIAELRDGVLRVEAARARSPRRSTRSIRVERS